ncbi:2-C-methyl-D-erythritol 4-phosphate cytidylyltransferase [Jatrophihabitans telluris]|uniref:2-C-methyl-D-erythritol 4-phosphate cytidylyltransferase n=1 Tax=Jatrophihabitans telluris TaxID=2038343 RepID=A0ABY4QZB2_9ACTN|nr:2-C-methyl-D-erythritol 4-phosphate cytidylyltransferase [Jatrophihabitans telluris]UQX88939.1 2-C-methyl-D-erythritol 4-phosphate cytidylyltransferase [Jatrophihabitans telluris]
MKCAVVVVAAGSGQRLAAGRPKALVELDNRPLVEWAVSAFLAVPAIEQHVVVAPVSDTNLVASLVGPAVVVVAGGADRQGSVANGLAALRADITHVLVHDAARPLVPVAVVEAVVAALTAGARAVIPVLPVTDTIKQIAEDGTVSGTLDRSRLRAVQTPQGFDRAVLVRAHEAVGHDAERTVTDDAALVEAMGIPVVTVDGSDLSMKITTAHDLQVAAALVEVHRHEAAWAGDRR